MKLQEIKDVISSQREEMEEKFESGTIIQREPDMARLRNLLSMPNIFVILGVRRCGKSIFSWQFFEKGFAYINFDDERLFHIDKEDLNRVLQAFYELYGKMEYIILDELQNVTGWELFANRLRRTKKVIITGSNSRLLAGELATHLTGRYIDFELFPFSFREFLAYKGIIIKEKEFYSTTTIAEIKRVLEEYLKIGGFPEVNIFGRDILVRIYSDILEKDVLRRLRVKKKQTYREFGMYMVSNIACEISMRKISRIFEIKDVHTVKNWLSGLENSYLFFVIQRYSPKLKQQMIAPKKIYCVDHGLANTMGFKLSKNTGRLMENLVAVELHRRKIYWNQNMEVYYWKDHQQREVDFVIKEGEEIKELLQICYDIEDYNVKTREIKALLKGSNDLKCKNLKIITWDHEDTETIDGRKIVYIPLWKWLLRK